MAYWPDLWDENRIQEHYHDYYSAESAAYDPITEKRYQSILVRMERIRPAGRILDVGCGAGHFLAVAESRGWKGTGVEVSRSALDLLARTRLERGSRFQVIQTDLEKAGLPERSFDAVTLFEVLEHLDDPLSLFRKSSALLNEGGLLYFTTPNGDSLSRRLLKGRWRVIAGEHRCLFNPASIRWALESAGLSPVFLRTKNIDLPELLSKLRGRRAGLHPTHRDSNSQHLRRVTERTPWLKGLKASLNGFLGLAGCGDTLEGLAVKREGSA